MIRIHPTADVSPRAVLGEGTSVWHQCQIREGAQIGEQCILGKNVYVDFDVRIGSRVKIQNNCSVYHGVTLEDGVFLGPHVVLTNDLYPRAINPDGSLKGNDDWEVGPILIRFGASIGARSVILPGVTIGRFALVGAGSVVTRDVPDYGLVYGTPARLCGYVCACGARLDGPGLEPQPGAANRVSPTKFTASGVQSLVCTRCGAAYANPPVFVASAGAAATAAATGSVVTAG